MRSSCDFLTVVLESRIMKYGGDFGSYVEMELSSNWFGGGDAAHFRIGYTRSEMLLMGP